MTHRERIRTVLRGELPDRISSVCRLDIWHRARSFHKDLPPDLASKTLAEIQLGWGMAVSARRARVFRLEYRSPVIFREWREGNRLMEEWTTPRGNLKRIRQYEGNNEAYGISPAIVQYPVQSPADYPILTEILSHRTYIPDSEAYRQYDLHVGNNGLPMVILGPTPFHEILLSWAGYENGFDHLYNDREQILPAIRAAETNHLKMGQVVAASPCELVLYGAHFDSAMTPPPIFKEYFLPHIQQFNHLLHQHGKKVAFHADADLRLLLDLVLAADYDVMDCLATEPLVACTFQNIRARTKGRMTLWGCIPSTLLEPPNTVAELRAHLDKIHAQAAPGDRLIWGFSDQAMPGSRLEHLQTVRDFIGSHGLIPG